MFNNIAQNSGVMRKNIGTSTWATDKILRSALASKINVGMSVRLLKLQTSHGLHMLIFGEQVRLQHLLHFEGLVATRICYILHQLPSNQ